MDSNNPSPIFDPNAETQPFTPEENSAPTQPVRTNAPAHLDPWGRPDLSPRPDLSATRPMPLDPYAYSELFPLDPNPQDQTRAIPVPPSGDPSDPLSQYQPVRVRPTGRPERRAWGGGARPHNAGRRIGCGGPGCLLILLLAALALAYFLAPINATLVIMGIDRSPEGTDASRTDTIILTSVRPLSGQVKLLSIPRDLWLPIAGVGENRINTAHFFAEANQPGSGPRALADTIEQNFGVHVPYTLRVRFTGFEQIIDAMGGVTLNLEEDAGGLSAGENHLTGAEALAFVRDRSGTDDFFRMSHTLTLLNALIRQALNPATWVRGPEVASALAATIDTNLPAWQWPRLGLALARAALTGGIDSQTLDRSMVTPTVTDGGAQVLLPQWDSIQPAIRALISGF